MGESSGDSLGTDEMAIKVRRNIYIYIYLYLLRPDWRFNHRKEPIHERMG